MYLVQGFWFEPKTGEVFDEEFNKQPFTFNPPAGYNPFQFATRSTAEKIARVLASLCVGEVSTSIEENALSGPIAPTPKLVVRVYQGGSMSEHNAGLVASGLMRQYESTLSILRHELTKNGIA